MHLPSSSQLPIDKLSAVFGSTVATYKFYWLLAIVELVEEGEVEINKKRIFARMIASSWYTINYFKLSFGKFDKFQEAVQKIKIEEGIYVDEHKINIIAKLELTKNPNTIKILNHFDKNVPHKFLSTWFPKSKVLQIREASGKFENGCLYSLKKDQIVINPIWIEYLKSNTLIIKHFCYWNLALFLQSRNPNVPDIPNKLIKSPQRKSLTNQLKNYWKPVFDKRGYIECIFTGKKLTIEDNNFALDHFVPHAYVSHDLIWNLIPIESKFNSSKSDNLPKFDLHFKKFLSLQKEAFIINRDLNLKNSYLLEFLTIFPSLHNFQDEKFAETIQPMLTIANNNGFLYMNE